MWICCECHIAWADKVLECQRAEYVPGEPDPLDDFGIIDDDLRRALEAL